MARGKGFHPFHIKRNTEGSSNEISFNVLENRKNSLEDTRTNATNQLNFSVLDNRAESEEGGSRKRRRFGAKGKGASKGAASSQVKGGIGIPLPLGGKRNKQAAGGVSGGASGSSSSAAGASRSSGASAAAGSSRSSKSSSVPLTNAARKAKKGKAKPTRPMNDEIALRKRNRRVRAVIGVVLGVMLIGVGVFGVNRFMAFQTTQEEKHALLAEGLAELAKTDETIVAIDTALTAPVDAEYIQKTPALLTKIDETNEQLDEAQSLVKRAFIGLRAQDATEAVSQAVVSIEARRELLRLGSEIIPLNVSAKEAYDATSALWIRIAEADGIARSASYSMAAISGEDAASIAAVEEQYKQALALFKGIRTDAEALANRTTIADLKPVVEYLDKYITSLEHAIASNEAMIIQDKKTADAENEASNTAATEASAIVKEFGSDPTKIIIDAYEKKIGDSLDTYVEIRKREGSADAYLRTFLGVETFD